MKVKQYWWSGYSSRRLDLDQVHYHCKRLTTKLDIRPLGRDDVRSIVLNQFAACPIWFHVAGLKAVGGCAIAHTVRPTVLLYVQYGLNAATSTVQLALFDALMSRRKIPFEPHIVREPFDPKHTAFAYLQIASTAWLA